MATTEEIRAGADMALANAEWAAAHDRPRMARLYRALARQLLALLD